MVEVTEAMKAAFKKFFDDAGANAEWSNWGEGRVMVDDVFNLDALLAAMTAASSSDESVTESCGDVFVDIGLSPNYRRMIKEVERLREALQAIADGAGVDWTHKPTSDLQEIARAALANPSAHSD